MYEDEDIIRQLRSFDTKKHNDEKNIHITVNYFFFQFFKNS